MFPRTLLDGAYTGFMSACDVAGNCADGSTFLINVDTVAPVLNAASVAGLTANQWGTATSANISLTFQDPNPNAVTVSGIDRAYAFIQGASASAPSVSVMTNSSYAATSCTSTCSLSFDRTLSEGNWSIWYLAYDEAGNQLGPLAVQDFLLVDLSGPSTSMPSFSTTLTNQSTLDVLWPAATDALSGVDGYRVRLINAATGSNVSSALVSNLSRTFSGLSDGVYRACVTAYDAVGNFGNERCTSSTSRIDTVNPVLSATSNISGWSGTNSVRLTWNASDDSNNVVVRFLQGSSWSQPFPANHSLVMSNLAEGLHTVQVKANDSAGNVQSVLLSFGIDVSNPTLTFVHAGGSGWTSDASHQFSWNATDAYSGIETVSMYVDGVVHNGDLPATGTLNLSFGSGQYEIELVVTDKVGNELTAVRYANVDLGQPALSCSLSAQGWSSTLPTASYVADGNGSVSNLNLVATYDGTPLSPNNGSIPLPASLPGNHSLLLDLSNQAGTSASCALTVQYDPTAPALTAAPTFPSVTSTSALLAGSSVQDLHSGLLDLQWNIDGVEYVYTSTSFSSNVLDLTMLSEGSHTAQLRVRDKVGNVRWWNHTFVHDVTAPQVDDFSLLTTTNNGWLNVSSGVFSFAVSDALDASPSARLFVNGAESSHAGGQATVPLMAGMNTVRLSVTDHGGLVTNASLVVFVDAATPTCILTSETGSEMWYNTSLRTFLATVQSGPSNVTSQLSINGGAAQPTQLSFETELQDGVSTLVVHVMSEAGLSTCSLVQRVDTSWDEVALAWNGQCTGTVMAWSTSASHQRKLPFLRSA